jgi:hypothetical protein
MMCEGMNDPFKMWENPNDIPRVPETPSYKIGNGNNVFAIYDSTGRRKSSCLSTKQPGVSLFALNNFIRQILSDGYPPRSRKIIAQIHSTGRLLPLFINELQKVLSSSECYFYLAICHSFLRLTEGCHVIPYNLNMEDKIWIKEIGAAVIERADFLIGGKSGPLNPIVLESMERIQDLLEQVGVFHMGQSSKMTSSLKCGFKK